MRGCRRGQVWFSVLSFSRLAVELSQKCSQSDGASLRLRPATGCFRNPGRTVIGHEECSALFVLELRSARPPH